MMPLTTMLAITEGVDAGEIPAPVLGAAGRWQADAGSVRHVRSSANHVFRFEREGSPYYLRLSPASERSPAGLEAELDFIEAVEAAGVTVARPVPSGAGTQIETVAGDGISYHAVVFAGLQGQAWLEPDELTPAMYRAWGETVGQIHRASQSYEPAAPRRPTWQERIAGARRRLAEEPAIRAELDRAADWLERLPRPAGAYGLIHGDPELDNLVWDGAVFHVMDFDDAHYHLYAFDVALALDEVWANEEKTGERTVLFLEGYRAVPGTPLINPALIPRFLRLNRALKAATLVRAYAGLPEEGVPQWVERLRARHREVLSETRATMADPFSW